MSRSRTMVLCAAGLFATFGVDSSLATEKSSITLVDDLVIGPSGSGVALGTAIDVDVDSHGNIYVIDAASGRIHKFTDHGQYVTSIGDLNSDQGGFDAPRCLAIGSDDLLYVAGGGPYVDVLDEEGVPLRKVERANKSAAQSIAVDDSGDIYVVALNLIDQKMIHRYDGKSGTLVRSFCDSYAVGRDIDTRIEAVHALGSIAIENDRIYYVQSYPHRIMTFDLAGELVGAFDARTTESEVPPSRFDSSGSELRVPQSLSRTIVPLDEDLLLTILALPFANPEHGGGFLDLYRASDGARLASMDDPPTAIISCRDRRGRLYSTEVRGNEPVVVRYRLEADS